MITRRGFLRKTALGCIVFCSDQFTSNPIISLEDIARSDIVRWIFSVRNDNFEYRNENGIDIDSDIIKIMHYNTAGLRGRDFDPERDILVFENGEIPWDRIEGIEQLLKEEKPDITAWTEIDWASKNIGSWNMVKGFAHDNNYVYSNNFGRDFRWGGSIVNMGNALISRYSIYAPGRQRIVDEQALSKARTANVERESRYGSKKMLHSYFMYKGQRIGFAVVHLDAESTQQNNAEFKLLMGKVMASGLPYIVAGDFNTYGGSRRIYNGVDYREFDGFDWLAQFEGIQLSTQGLTYPSNKPEVALDHTIIVNPKEAPIKLKLIETYTRDVLYSDHLPVFSRIKIIDSR